MFFEKTFVNIQKNIFFQPNVFSCFFYEKAKKHPIPNHLSCKPHLLPSNKGIDHTHIQTAVYNSEYATKIPQLSHLGGRM